MSNTMILLYLVFIKILLNSLKTSILQNIYATKPFKIMQLAELSEWAID